MNNATELVLAFGSWMPIHLPPLALSSRNRLEIPSLAVLRHGTPREPADLAGHECVGLSAWPTAFSRQWRFVRDGTEHAVSANLAAGRLVRVLEGYALPARPMHLLYAADRRMTPKLRAFVDWMLRALGPDAPAFSA
ncbi:MULTISPECIES: LysR substrate-binding domain-containing protein [Pseudomonadota]|uniref:LysR substrate-binding domain-containing protein n=2 Tax=Pseudomonadota TaxID=1224 RepID=UPI0023E0E56C|nr:MULTISPECIES: LysR substrate-binding domain-containing protein [Pseudomonadota]